MDFPTRPSSLDCYFEESVSEMQWVACCLRSWADGEPDRWNGIDSMGERELWGEQKTGWGRKQQRRCFHEKRRHWKFPEKKNTSWVLVKFKFVERGPPNSDVGNFCFPTHLRNNRQDAPSGLSPFSRTTVTTKGTKYCHSCWWSIEESQTALQKKKKIK